MLGADNRLRPGSPDTPGAGSQRTFGKGQPQPAASRRAAPFFELRSFSMALSSIASASSFFSLAFASSSAFRRLASETSRPPYLAFHLQKGRAADPVLAADIGRLGTGFLLL
jgi:hypothetical protein